jgi:hypothetical protein
MPFREKHTGNFWDTFKFFNVRKDLRSLVLAMVFLFILSQGFASGKDVVFTSGNTTVVYTTGDTNRVVITEGKITAVGGKALRLLPGTHIRSGEQLTVNIASKACQEAVAEEVAKEAEVIMLAYAAKQRMEVLEKNEREEIPVIFKTNQLPEHNSVLGQQSLQLTAGLVYSTVSLTASISLLNKKISLLTVHDLLGLSNQWLYTPVYSWGDCAETIKVMLC